MKADGGERSVAYCSEEDKKVQKSVIRTERCQGAYKQKEI